VKGRVGVPLHDFVDRVLSVRSGVGRTSRKRGPGPIALGDAEDDESPPMVREGEERLPYIRPVAFSAQIEPWLKLDIQALSRTREKILETLR